MCLLLMLIGSGRASAQQCPKNMLSIPEEGGYVGVKDDPAVRLDKAMTVEMWVRLNSSADRSTIIEKGNIGSFVNYSLALGPLNTVVARVLTPTGVVTLSSDFIPNISDWHHYAVVFRPNDSLYLYVDGERSAAVKVFANALSTGADSLRIGHSIVTGGKNLYGSIDELRLWKVARTQSEINADKGHVIPKTTLGLSAYFTFDDDASHGLFFENKGLIATLHHPALLVPSTSPVNGTPPAYKLQLKESRMDLPVKSCISQFDTVVHVRNLGLDSVHVNAMGLVRGAAFSIAGPERLDLPADSAFYGEIRIQFNPTKSGIYIDTLIIGSNSACAGQIRIPLIDTFVSSDFEIVQKQLSLSNVLNCELPITRKITLRNAGSTLLNITKSYFTNDIGMEIKSPTSFPLPPGASSDVTIQVTKGVDGFSSASLVFESDICKSAQSIPVTITRESITYDVPAQIDLGERMIMSDELTIDTVIHYRNTSSREVVIRSAGITGTTAYTVTSQIFNVALAAGDELAIPVRLRVTTCGQYAGTLHIFGSPCTIDATVPLKVSVTGPKPEIASVVDVGFNCSAKDTTLLLRNPYDSTITLTGYSFSQSGVFTTTTKFPLTIAPQSSRALELRFKPAVEKEYEVNLTMTNAKCGTMVIKLRGSYGTRSLAVTPRVSFGRGCDMSAIRRDVVITNNSPREAVIATSAITQSTRFKVIDADLPLLIVPGESKNITVEFTPEFGAISKGLLSFTIAGGCNTEQAELYGSREEPVLTLNNAGLNFDTLCPLASRTIDLLVSNIGIDSVDLTSTFSAASGAFRVANAARVLRKGANVLPVTFNPLANGHYRDTLVLAVPGCGIDYRVALEGVGGSAPVLTYSSVELQFGKIEVGKQEERCITITNPSCTPVTIDASSFVFSGNEFNIKQSSLDQLPRTLQNGEGLDVCITYQPQRSAIDEADLQISAGGVGPRVLKLRGQGIAPDLRFAPPELDFGFVPVNDQRPLSFSITNAGEVAAALSLSIDQTSSAFSLDVPSLTVGPGETKPVSINFLPDATGLFEGSVVIDGAGQHLIPLRGIGSERGLVIERTAIDFGDVRVGKSASEVFTITANVPLTELRSIELPPTSESSYYHISTDPQLPFTFVGPTDEVRVMVVFEPGVEQTLNTSVLLKAQSQVLPLDLKGRGVDAHIVTPEVIDFNIAELETTTYRDLIVTNTGEYPLTITAASTAPPFAVGAIASVIPPGEQDTFSVGFTPVSRKQSIGELRITSDAFEGERTIRLVGKGGDGVQSVPRIAYEPTDVSAVIGEQATIPITIVNGSKLEQFSADSFYLEFRYDPWMLHLTGVDASNSVTSGLSIETRKLDDSTFAISGNGQAFNLANGQRLIELKGEALWGPRERTTMQIFKAYPSTASTITDAIAEFRVTNCKDQTAAAIYKGAYSVEQAFPTPTKNSATIAYKLGFNGAAEIEIIDDIGRSMKTMQLPERPKGEYTFVLDVSDLPNGHYSGLFRSREFLKRIDLIVQH